MNTEKITAIQRLATPGGLRNKELGPKCTKVKAD